MIKEIEIPEGYEARIDGNKVILEPKESEDERIRKALVNFFKNTHDWVNLKYDGNEIVAYLEKQKDSPMPEDTVIFQKGVAEGRRLEREEQQPAEWSEEDEKVFNGVIDTIKDAIAECDCDDVGTKARIIYEKELKWLETRLKSLRPQPHWKPSEEQMAVLYDAISNLKHDNYKNTDVLESFYNDIEKL